MSVAAVFLSIVCNIETPFLHFLCATAFNLVCLFVVTITLWGSLQILHSFCKNNKWHTPSIHSTYSKYHKNPFLLAFPPLHSPSLSIVGQNISMFIENIGNSSIKKVVHYDCKIRKYAPNHDLIICQRHRCLKC